MVLLRVSVPFLVSILAVVRGWDPDAGLATALTDGGVPGGTSELDNIGE